MAAPLPPSPPKVQPSAVPAAPNGKKPSFKERGFQPIFSACSEAFSLVASGASSFKAYVDRKGVGGSISQIGNNILGALDVADRLLGGQNTCKVGAEIAAKVWGTTGSDDEIKEACDRLETLTGSKVTEKAICDFIPQFASFLIPVIEKCRENVRIMREREAKEQDKSKNRQLTKGEHAGELAFLHLVPNMELLRHKFPKPLQTGLLKGFANWLEASRKLRGWQPPTENPVLEIFAYFVHVANKHSEGKGNVLDQIADIERIADPVVRDKRLAELFAPILKEIMLAAFPNGAKDLNLDYLGFVNNLVWDIINDPQNMLMLFRNLFDPTIVAAERKATLEQTNGGKMLLHFTKLITDRGIPLLLQLTENQALNIGLCAFPGRDPADPLKVDWRQPWLGNRVKGLAQSQDPMLKPFKDLGAYWLESATNEMWINFATRNGAQPLNEGEDPFRRVAIRVCELIAELYQQHGETLREQFEGMQKQYSQFRERSLEYAALLATPRDPDPAKELGNLQRRRELKKYLDDWEFSPERIKLVETVFVPLTESLVKAAGLEKRLNVLGLGNDILKIGIPNGLCSLYEQLLTAHPGCIQWLNPAFGLAEDEKTLNDLPNGEECVGMVDATIALAQQQIPGVLQNRAQRRSLTKVTIDLLESLMPHAGLSIPPELQGYLRHMMGVGMRHVAKLDSAQDPLWGYALTFLRKTGIGSFLHRTSEDNDSSNPVESMMTKALAAIHSFRSLHAAEVDALVDQLPDEPSEADLKPVYDIFREHLVDKLLEITGLDKVLGGNGFLTIFGFHKECIHLLSKKFFEFYQKFSKKDEVQKQTHNALCRVLYDEKAYLATLKEGTDLTNVALQQTLQEKASVAGKTDDQLAKLWVDSGVEDAAMAIQHGCAFVVEQMLTRNVKTNAREIATWIFSMCGHTLPGAELQLLTDAISHMSESHGRPVKKAWAYIRDWITLHETQSLTNMISSSYASMPRKPGAHRWDAILGDLTARISNVVAAVAGKPLNKGDRQPITTSPVKRKKDCQRGVRLGKALLKMAAPRNARHKTQLPMRGFPLADSTKKSLWGTLSLAVGKLLGDAHNQMTPDMDKFKVEMRKIFGDDSVSEFCRMMAVCVRDLTPFSLSEDKAVMGPSLFDCLQDFLAEYPTGPGKALFDLLHKNRDLVKQFITDNIGLIGGNKDSDDTLRHIVWPALQQYSFPIIMLIMTKFSESMEVVSNDSSFSLKLFKGLLQLISTQLEIMNGVAKEKGKTVDQVTMGEMVEGFGGELDPTLREEVNMEPEEREKHRKKRLLIPEVKKLFQRIGLTAEDMPVPDYLKEPMFTYLQKVVGPFVMQFCLSLFFKEDGVEDTLNKIEIKAWDNLKRVLETITAHISPDDAAAPAEDDDDLQPHEDKELFEECGKLIHQMVKMFPEPILRGIAIALTDISARQWGRALQRMAAEQPLIKMMHAGLRATIENMFPKGKWVGDHFVMDDEVFEPRPEPEDVVKQKIADRVQEVTYKAAEVPTQGMIIIMRQFFVWLWRKIESMISYFFLKVLGKHAESFSIEMMRVLAYIGKLISWILYPLDLAITALARVITHAFMRRQATVIHAVRNHRVMVNVPIRGWKCAANLMDESLRNQGVST